MSFRRRAELRDVTGDPWNGRSLEWSTASPPPAFNFAVLPQVHTGDVYWEMKRARGKGRGWLRRRLMRDIEIPRNSPTGFICAFFATTMGFALIWQIWWMAAASFVGAYATFVVFAWRDRAEDVLPAAEVARIDRENLDARGAALAAPGPAQ